MKKIILVFLTLFSWQVFAANVQVLPVHGKGLSESDVDTVQELFNSAVDSVSGFKSVRDQAANIQLKPIVLRLGNAFIVRAVKYKRRKKVSSQRMKSTDFEDLDVVITRVTRAALLEESVKNTARVDDVTKDEEARSQRKYKATKQFQFGFGVASATSLKDEGTGKQVSAGYKWGIDPDFDLQLVTDLYLPNKNSDVQFLGLSIGLDYFLNSNKNAPFVGGGIGYGVATASDGSNLISSDDASGWVGNLEVGMKFFRTSTVNLGLVLRSSYMFDKTDVSKSTPSVTSLKLMIYY